MRNSFVVAVVCFLILGAIGCAQEDQQRPPADVAFKEIWVVLDGIEAPADKVPILETYIAEYPDTEESERALGDVIYYRLHEMDDPQGALAITRKALDQTLDPELRFKIGLRLHDLSDQAGEATDLRVVADELAAHREFGFVDHLDVVEAAEKSGGWELMLEHAAGMEAFASEKAFRAAYPDDDFTDEQVTYSANRRRAWVLAYKGGALTNLGRLEDAEGVFLEAEGIPAVTDYLGIPETPIDIYRGQAALLLDRPEEAVEFFAHDALMGRESRALEGLEKAFLEISGSATGYEESLGSLRERIARPLPDVELGDYEGSRFRLASTAGRVAVISFWNPG